MNEQPNTPGAFVIRVIVAVVVGLAAGIILASNPYMPLLAQLGIVVGTAVAILALLFWRS